MKTKFYTILASLFLVLAVNTSNAQNTFDNGDFEAWTLDVPDDWTTIETEITLSEETTTIHGGSSACNVLINSGDQGNTDFRQDVDVVAGTTYDVSIWVYQVDTTAKMRLYVDGYEGYSIPNLQDQWQEVTFTYDATTTDTIEVGTRYYDVTGFVDNATIIIDDFTFTPQIVVGPEVTITSPEEGASLGSGDVTIDFTTQNFVVAPIGDGDGHIHYSVDGNMTMYYSPDPIDLTGLTDGSHTVILQLVDDTHTPLSPNVADTVNFTVSLPTNVATIADLRAGTEGEFYTLTGEAFVTFAQSFRNQKFIQDASGAILIDDNDGLITTTYIREDGMTGLSGELGSYGGMLQFIPTMDPGAPSSTGNVVAAIVVSVNDLNTSFDDYESQVVLVEGATYLDAGANFENGTSYDIVQGVDTMTFRTQFYDVDYIGTVIPEMAHITAIAVENWGTSQVISRDLMDINVVEVPANDLICDASEVIVDGDAVTVDNTDATFGGDSATCWDTHVSGDVWLMFEFTPTDELNGIEVTTQAGSSDDSQLALYTATGCPDGPVVLTQLYCNEDVGDGNFMSYISTVELDAGTYYIQCGTWGSGEGSFDVEVNAIFAQPVAGESFEGELFVPECWTSIDADGDGSDWFQYGASNSAYAGLFSAASASWNGGALTPDNYLVSPQLILGTDEALTYHVGAQDPAWPAEKYGVYISTAGNEEADFTTELFVETLSDGDWHAKSVDLSAYNGMTVYLAFRHYDVTDNFVLKLDNIMLPGSITGCATGIEEVEKSDFTLYPNPNNGQFTIVNEGVEGDYTIQVIEVTGKVVHNEQLHLSSNDNTVISTDGLKSGMYIVKMINTDENYFRTLRMVIK